MNHIDEWKRVIQRREQRKDEERKRKSKKNELFPTRLLFTCGTPENPYCRDCGVCETLYWRYLVNHDKAFPHGLVVRALEDMTDGT